MTTSRRADASTLRYDLKRPCSDCPFRVDTPHHEGIATGLTELYGCMEMGTAAHSCHKTDPAADGFSPSYQGPIQHCAGFMIMQRDWQRERGDDLQPILARAVRFGQVDLAQLETPTP